jgi:hypothetical protein
MLIAALNAAFSDDFEASGIARKIMPENYANKRRIHKTP